MTNSGIAMQKAPATEEAGLARLGGRLFFGRDRLLGFFVPK